MDTDTVQVVRKLPKTPMHIIGLNGSYVLNVPIFCTPNFIRTDLGGELEANISRNQKQAHSLSNIIKCLNSEFIIK